MIENKVDRNTKHTNHIGLWGSIRNRHW